MLAPTLWLAAGVLYAASHLHNPKAGVWLASLCAAYAIGLVMRPARIWLGFMVLITLNLLVCAFDWFYLDHYDFAFAGNQNYLGAAIALSVAAAITYDYLWFIPVAGVGLWFTTSRTSLVAASIAVLVGLWRRFPVLSTVGTAAFLLCAIAASRDGSMWQRMGIWQDTLSHLTIWGHGYGSFLDTYASFPVKTNLTGVLAQHPYNDFLEYISDLGLGAIPFFVGIILCLEAKEGRLIAGIFLILSMTFFPSSIPLVAQMFALTLGRLAAERKPYGKMAIAQRALS